MTDLTHLKPLALCICGSRTLTAKRVPPERLGALVDKVVHLMTVGGIMPYVAEVVSGCARGADRLGEEWAKANGVRIEPYPAEWEVYRGNAGLLRNSRMVEHLLRRYRDRWDVAVLALRAGWTPGTQDMIRKARDAGIPVVQEYV